MFRQIHNIWSSTSILMNNSQDCTFRHLWLYFTGHNVLWECSWTGCHHSTIFLTIVNYYVNSTCWCPSIHAGGQLGEEGRANLVNKLADRQREGFDPFPCKIGWGIQGMHSRMWWAKTRGRRGLYWVVSASSTWAVAFLQSLTQLVLYKHSF